MSFEDSDSAEPAPVATSAAPQRLTVLGAGSCADCAGATDNGQAHVAQ